MKGTSFLNLRLLFMKILVAVVFLGLAGQLWRLQIVQGHVYRSQADRNRFRLVRVDAPRGVIYDRQRRIMVRNEPSFTVSVVPADLPAEDEERVFSRLSQLLGIPVSTTQGNGRQGGPPVGAGQLPGVESRGIRELVKAGRATPFVPVPIKSRVAREVAFIIEEEHLDLPGVQVQVEPIRRYLQGPLTAHILGHMGRIPAERLEEYLGQPDGDYELYDRVGVTGIEYTYEKELRGEKGLKHIEVDALGREVRVVSQPVMPTPGHNLILTLDLELQEAAERALRRGMGKVGSESGVVIAMNPKTGEILAMVSLPSYDNNLFAGGISPEDYARLINDPLLPLFNRAISGEYPVGSTFKIVPAAAGLQEGVISQSTLINDPGAILVPNKYFPDDPTQAQPFFCWKEDGHGWVDVIEGLAQSCDVFFYVVAGGYQDFQGLGAERLIEYARLFGFGEPTGIALPGESAGLVPDDRWKRHVRGQVWVTGDTYNMAIGQGDFLATPLQLLNATAAVANGGTLYRPQLVYQVEDVDGQVVRAFTPQVIRTLPIAPEHLAIVREGLRGAVTHGTAYWAGLPTEVEVAGKTGTAEYFGPLDEEGNLPTHAWFTAFAPYDDPEIALVVFVAGGGEGSSVAAPIAAEILRAYFGLPEPSPEELPTPVRLGDR